MKKIHMEREVSKWADFCGEKNGHMAVGLWREKKIFVYSLKKIKT